MIALLKEKNMIIKILIDIKFLLIYNIIKKTRGLT